MAFAAAALPYLAAAGSAAGGLASLKSQQPPTLPGSGGVGGMGGGGGTDLSALSNAQAPNRYQAVQQGSTDAPRMPIPQTNNDYDRNLMEILNVIQKGRG